MTTKFITNEQLYDEVIDKIANAKKSVYIGTSDIKDLHVKHKGTVQSFLYVLNLLVEKKVDVRLLHAKEPGMNFRKSFDKYPKLWKQMERQLCPRVHFKHIIIDNKLAYTGSANLTGAGLGIKSPKRRNFESGILTTDKVFIKDIKKQFDEVWKGKFCKDCGRKDFCADPIA